jgi:hypothetical protein
MPKKNHSRRNLKGGDVSQTFTSLGNSIKQVASSAWTNTKKALGLGDSYSSSTYTPSSSTYTSSSSSYTQPSTTTQTNYSGGRGRRRGRGRKMHRSRKNKRGGFNPNMQPLLVARANEPINTLASRAAPYTGGPSASVSYVGGRKRKTRRVKH